MLAHDENFAAKRVVAESKSLVAEALVVTTPTASSSLEGQSHEYSIASKEKILEKVALKLAATSEAEATAASFEEAVA